jgi:hypothetical protein
MSAGAFSPRQPNQGVATQNTAEWPLGALSGVVGLSPVLVTQINKYCVSQVHPSFHASILHVKSFSHT